mgnify:CR=1 FL=1
MFVLVESGSITKTLSGNKGITIGDIQYPQNIFTLWTASEKEAIGVYTIVHDNSNRKDQTCYTNTDVSYAFADGKVTASYGTATPKELEDTVNEDNSIADGLKSQKKANIKQQASSLLAPTDWYVVKVVEVESYSVPEATTTYRADVRTASNDMESKIDACTTVDELAALYVYTDGSRPLGEFPKLET